MKAGTLAESGSAGLAGVVAVVAELAPSASVALAVAAGVAAVGCWRGMRPALAPAIYRAVAAVATLGVGIVADPEALGRQAGWLAGVVEAVLWSVYSGAAGAALA
ncbi:hypothetical protein [Azospirillum thermophilum]|uniref:Uncharacterized protein n=1 Tax=Azospirillum thermophilum TaxID=2202148 RepID=A0A2S2CKW0_9PROT|nr:hypothetical protein [Azospirillum thermophilum]AWK85010.1 hypothetical protein DEW08_01385 [Azospirillum thermophilum]